MLVRFVWANSQTMVRRRRFIHRRRGVVAHCATTDRPTTTRARGAMAATAPVARVAPARAGDAGRRATRATTTRPRRRDVDVAGARARDGRGRRARATAPRAIDPAHADAAREVARAIGDVAVGVGLPCTVQNCGDAIYRSTLDAELRREIAPLLTPAGATILAIAATYGAITPGVIPGLVDFYLLRPVLGTLRRRYALEDFALGKKLGEGGFGVVYEATGVKDQKKYVLKRATDYGEAEVWMNSRLQIACPGACADFVSAFEGPPVKKGDDEPSLWLVWKYEGKRRCLSS